MDQRSSYSFIVIGLYVRALRHIVSSNPNEYVVKQSNYLLAALKQVGFAVSSQGCQSLVNIAGELKKLDPRAAVGTDVVKRVNEAMGHIETIVFAEAQIKTVYTFPERRFNADYLQNSPWKLFKNGVFTKLSPIAMTDIASACKCILFGEATAAAFHCLRATEEVLKHYYFHHKKQKRLKNPMWGPMTAELRAKKNRKPSEAVLDSLDLVRKQFRNPMSFGALKGTTYWRFKLPQCSLV